MAAATPHLLASEEARGRAQSGRVRLETAEERVRNLYDAHHRKVFYWALRVGAGDRAFAEDVTHDVFVRLLQHIDRLSDDEEMGAWLHRVTVRLAFTRLSRARWRTQLLDRFGFGFLHHAPEAEARIELSETLTALGELPEKERVVLLLLHVDGWSQSEIARELGLSKGYVSKLVRRGTETLRKKGWEEP